MELTSGEIIISSKSGDIGSVETIVPDSYTGGNLSIAFKGQYVYDAIRVLGALKVKVQFGGTMKPFIITSLDDEDVLQLVLPIKTYN
jgi:DNA polymerase-3 subunit beta